MSKIAVRDAISAALAEEMRRDEKVFVMGEDVALTGGVYKAMWKNKRYCLKAKIGVKNLSLRLLFYAFSQSVKMNIF